MGVTGNALRMRRAWALIAMALGMTLAYGEETPNAFVQRVSQEVLEVLRTDPAARSGDVQQVMPLVERVLIPHVNFGRMTAMAVGPAWRQATAQQRGQLQQEFKLLLVRTYAGALMQADANRYRLEVLPFRGRVDDADALVRTRLLHGGEPVQIDFRLQKSAGADGWQIYNVNVLGVWFVETWRSQFAPVVNAGGVQGLIDRLVEQNRSQQPAQAPPGLQIRE